MHLDVDQEDEGEQMDGARVADCFRELGLRYAGVFT